VRIVFISHYFPPEVGAPAARVSELSAAWASKHDVTVLTGFPNHPTGRIPAEYRGRFLAEETRDGYRVLRCWLYATRNEGIVKRTISHVSFALTAFVIGLYRLRRPDVIVATSPTFFCVFTAWALGLRFRCPFVFEVRDLWPGVFVQLGVLKSRTLIRALERAEVWLYRRARLVVTVTKGFAEDIRSRGIPADKLVVIPNGADLRFFTPGPPSSMLRKEMGASEKDFLVLYIGAHGISHALDRVLDAAAALRDSSGIRFALVGDGARKAELERLAAADGLENVRFLPSRPRQEVPDFYRSADLCLVPLKDVPLFSTFIPSKMFEIMACGRPILASVRGEAAEILRDSAAALVVEPEDVSAMRQAIERLRSDAEARARMGLRGRSFVEKHYDRAELAERYRLRLEDIAR
jgi:glycosyltransferase involved in cell wall biosynthesis